MADKQTAPREAIMQFECDRRRMKDMEPTRDPHGGHQTHWWKVTRIGEAALFDTFKNGGTFVLVVTPDKITMVQRADAEEL